MKNNENSIEIAQFYCDLYSWATLALSHPHDESSIEDTLDILEEINNTPQTDRNIDLNEDIEELKVDEKIRSLDLLFLQQEHSRLFIGPFSLLAPPYESYYRGNHTLMGEISSEVEKFYQYAGMKISSNFKDAPDHVILETEFLARLCEMECVALENKQQEKVAAIKDFQLAFLQKHLLTWIDALQAALEKEAQSRYYPLIVQILNKAARNHYHSLQESVSGNS